MFVLSSCRLQEGVVEVVSGVLHKEVTAMVDLQAKAPPHKTEKDRKVSEDHQLSLYSSFSIFVYTFSHRYLSC